MRSGLLKSVVFAAIVAVSALSANAVVTNPMPTGKGVVTNPMPTGKG